MITKTYSYIIFFFGIGVFFSCSHETVKKEDAFKNFHNHFKADDFDLLAKDLDDSIVIYDNNGRKINRENYVKDLRDWASAFNTQWHVVKWSRSGDTTRSVEYDSDQLNDYLYNGALQFQYTYVEKNNKLVYLRWDTLPGSGKIIEVADMRYRSFGDWVKKYYPGNAQSLAYKTPEAYSLVLQMLSEYLRAPEGREARVVSGTGR